MEIVTPAEIAIVKDMMSKYGLTNKDLFSFCICAVNFLEYYHEESMYDMMWSCPERYANADSDNTRAVAGALKGEQKAEGWTEVEQFAYYMQNIQDCIASELEEELDEEDEESRLEHFFAEYERFLNCYKRAIMLPIMFGCKVEDFDDEQGDFPEYILSIINVDGMTLYKKHNEERDAWHKKCEEERAAELAKEVEEKKNDDDFAVLLVSCVELCRMRIDEQFKEYNQTYYPTKNYKVVQMKNPGMLIIQTGGKDIEEVKDRILKTVEGRIIIVGRELQKKLLPVENVFKDVPPVLVDYKVTHVVTYV